MGGAAGTGLSLACAPSRVVLLVIGVPDSIALGYAGFAGFGIPDCGCLTMPSWRSAGATGCCVPKPKAVWLSSGPKLTVC